MYIVIRMWAGTHTCTLLSECGQAHLHVHYCYQNVDRHYYMYIIVIRIVGEDDGGKPFTPEEFEEYKKKVLPMVTNYLLRIIRL